MSKNTKRSTDPISYHYNNHSSVPRRTVQKKSKSHIFRKATAIILLILVLGGGIAYAHHNTSMTKINVAQSTGSNATPVTTKINPSTTKPTTTTASPGVCAPNTVAQQVVVSISARRMWACQATTQVYSSAVITGMMNYAADLTPTGTYTIYAKQRDLYLNGSDSTGSWHDYVYYWMPFLNNQYGTYGFHDATWRAASAFGNISPYSDQASHGCVEMPLATAAWLYGWAQIGTTVTIES